MVDSLSRWCLFCDLEVHASAEKAPQPDIKDYVADLSALVEEGEAKRVYEKESRVARIAKCRVVDIDDETPGLALLITLGDRRGSDPSFVHFEDGTARNPDKLPGEVKGASAHVVISLIEDMEARGRYRMLIEETRGIGRTPVSRLLASVFKELAEKRGDQFKNPATGRMNAYRPIVEVHPRQSQEMTRALDRGKFLPVELLDTSPVPSFDENPEYQVRRHLLSVKVTPAPGRTFRQAANDLALKAAGAGYDRMRVNWRMPGEMRGGTSEMSTDIADLGTAMFAHRELIEIEASMADCATELNDDFIRAMCAKFV
ncbi:hypothetical protein [Sphingomonas phyllosphaerae]|uniref:hypothetical protein n=1 Tax=Sphingomonas phyllosphaerae TaxID=257003 RepID=UPI0012DD6FB7|nr:hypothetical protein [Sphingomonas phyllosphaerae]